MRRIMGRNVTLMVLTCALFLFCGAEAARAATFTVNQSGDAGDGVCDATCTLRDAVTAANGAASDDIITFNSGLTSITLTSEIVIANNGTLTINGPGANLLTITGGGAGTNRLFSLSASANVTITGVTLTGGGGTGATDTGRGGAIYGNGATLTLDGVHVTNNSADFYGGGLYMIGTLHIRNSTFSGNTATQFSGGGLYVIFAGVSISNSTFSGNTAGQFGGGGHFEQSSATLRNVTATANTASTGGGFDGIGGGSINLGNTIVAGNTATARNELSSQSGTTLISAGNNLIGDSPGDAADTNSTITYQSTDILDTPPVLGPLQNNGGPTPTRALLTYSRAIDRGDNAKAVDPFDNSALTTDQRGAGFPRAVDGNGDGIATVDIGAFELQSPTAATASLSGRITDAFGHPLGGVLITLSGATTGRTITDSEGSYRFDNLQTDGFYTLTPSRANYSFGPVDRGFSLLADKSDATFVANPQAETANPLDTPEFFVRQQYLDFLGREPEQGGLDYWSAQLRHCQTDVRCINARRNAVAAAFYIEAEFQQTGYFVYRFYESSYGSRPDLAQFQTDRSKIVAGASLEEAKQRFADEWVKRAEFLQAYPLSMTGDEFVGKLFDTMRLPGYTAERQRLADELRQGKTRAEVLREAIEMMEFKQREYNRAFVLMQYFGYLKRDPEAAGYDFWLNVLDNKEPNNYLGMVCSFTTSAEYQKRFSSIVTHSNQECSQ